MFNTSTRDEAGFPEEALKDVEAITAQNYVLTGQGHSLPSGLDKTAFIRRFRNFAFADQADNLHFPDHTFDVALISQTSALSSEFCLVTILNS